MSQSKSSSQSKPVIKSHLGFEEGGYAARKGRLCLIKKIHFEMEPPSVTVKMMDNDCEVGTEFDRLQHVESWFCNMCTAQNGSPTATKCCFCGMARDYKEKVTVTDHAVHNTQTDAVVQSDSGQAAETDSEESEIAHFEHEQSETASDGQSELDDDEEDEEEEDSQIEDESEEETDEEPQPAMYRPHRPPQRQRYQSYAPFESQWKRPRRQQAPRRRPQSNPFPTFWPSTSLFGW